ncbi:MAG: hypothetical protein ABJB86_19235, partial [Bacteroidota bacterium]
LLAGKPAQQNIRVTIPGLVTAYYTGVPDIASPGQRVAFGTSCHRGSSFTNSFKENHISAITQAICFTAKNKKLTGHYFPALVPMRFQSLLLTWM